MQESQKEQIHEFTLRICACPADAKAFRQAIVIYVLDITAQDQVPGVVWWSISSMKPLDMPK